MDVYSFVDKCYRYVEADVLAESYMLWMVTYYYRPWLAHNTKAFYAHNSKSVAWFFA